MKNTYRVLIVVSFFAITLVGMAHAVPPRDWNFLKNKPANFKPCRMLSPEQISKLQAKGVLRKTGRKGVISAQTKKIIVVRVRFPDGPAITTSKTDTEAFFAKCQKYYAENSYGLLTVTATVTGSAYTLPSSIGNYNNESDTALALLRTDTVALSSGDVNFGNYDYMMIYHAGYGEEDSGLSSDLWSLFYGGNFTAGGKVYDGFTVVPELARSGSSPLGVICHEFGHQLGLPDLYDTSVTGGRSTCGAWSLMDYPYAYDNTGRNPPHLDPWCKNYLQFIDLSSRIADHSISSAFCGDIETCQTTGFYKIPADASGSSQEYFIVEYRDSLASKMKYDLSIPGSGMLIWHIDDSIALSNTRLSLNTVNTGSPHLGVDLVEADGTATFPPGQAGDAFAQGNIFTSPMSNTFSGQPSNIALSDIAFSGDRSDFKLRLIAAATSVRIDKLINYPNPAGSGYPHPRQGSGILTTFVMHVTRPPQNMSMGIYDLAGERVNMVVKDKINLRLDPSSDNKWVYEFDWDGKNDSGEDVAPGVYFCKFIADGEVKLGKLVIVR